MNSHDATSAPLPRLLTHPQWNLERSSRMHRLLLGFAAVAVIGASSLSTTATARDGAFVGRPSAPADRFGGSPGFRGDPCRDHRDGDHRRVDRCRSDVVMDWYGGEWALYNNRSW